MWMNSVIGVIVTLIGTLIVTFRIGIFIESVGNEQQLGCPFCFAKVLSSSDFCFVA